MFIRPCYRKKNGQRHAYWALVQSYRSERGPRQRVVAYLGQMDQIGRLGIKNAAQNNNCGRQKLLFDETEPEWVEVDAGKIRVENSLSFGGPWLALELIHQLGLHEFLAATLPLGKEQIPWSIMSLTLIICRLCEPSSELNIAEHFYRQSALSDLLGVPADKINEQRLYRSLDALLPHKEALEVFLKERLGDLFDLEYDLLLYDVTSTYFEGRAQGNPLAEAEAAFRIHKSDLRIRPIWHQKEDRVLAHILVCFLAFVLWKTLGQWCKRAGLGDEPRRILNELAKINVVDVILPTRKGIEIRKRCITQPNEHQAILLQRLGLILPKNLKQHKCSEDF